MKGKYLEPNLTDHVLLSNDAGLRQGHEIRKDRSAILLCMPYFCVAPYFSEYPSYIPNFHPMRTLLQSSFISTPRKRGLQQAICNLENPNNGHCFHVPQIWCLILGGGRCCSCLHVYINQLTLLDLLITCTHLPTASVKRGLGGIKILPASGANESPRIRVSHGGTGIWLLPVTDCMTWLVSRTMEW